MDELELLKLKLAEVTKELDKVNRVNKLLRKKVTRLRKREERLVTEIEELDVYEAIEEEIKRQDDFCPQCGCKVDHLDTPIGFTILMCTRCSFRTTVNHN